MSRLDSLRPERSVLAHRMVVLALTALSVWVAFRTAPHLALIPADVERRFALGPLNLLFAAYALLISLVVTWRTGHKREGRHMALLLGYLAACMALSIVPAGVTETWRQALFGLCWLGAIVEGLKFFTAFPRPLTLAGIEGFLGRRRKAGLLHAADRGAARAAGALVGTLWAKAAFTAVALGFAYRLVGQGSHRYNILSDFIRPSGLPLPLEVLLELSGGAVIVSVAAVAWTSFRLADAEERRRMLWIVLAQLTVAVFTVASLLLALLWGLTGSESIGFVRGIFAVGYHPFIWFVDLSGFALAIFYSGAFDLRPVITKTTLYGALFLILTFLFATVEELAQDALTNRLGVPEGLGTWLGAGVIAVALGPVRERLQRVLQRVGEALESTLAP